jgi:hypothetical protein
MKYAKCKEHIWKAHSMLFWSPLCTDSHYYRDRDRWHETAQAFLPLNPYQPIINYHLSI